MTDNRRVVQRKNFLLTRDLDGNAWTQNIFIDFTPDEMIVKSMLYVADGTEFNPDYLTSDLVNWDPLCLVSDNHMTNPDTRYILNRQVRGLFNFEVRPYSGALSSAEGQLMVILEFVQYEH